MLQRWTLERLVNPSGSWPGQGIGQARLDSLCPGFPEGFKQAIGQVFPDQSDLERLDLIATVQTCGQADGHRRHPGCVFDE